MHLHIHLTASSIADPGSGVFLTPGSGIGKKIKIRIRDEHHIFESLETIFGLKLLGILMRIQIRNRESF
jgi:hypothetical protein